MKNPYEIIKNEHVTEKATTLANLATSESNVSVRRCNNPKRVFIVDRKATKQEIAKAIEMIYSERNVKVVKVNTINVKPKPKRMRGKRGRTSSFRKAVVTFDEGDNIDNI